MRCARFFITVMSAVVILLIQTQVSAQVSPESESSAPQVIAQNDETKIMVKDAPSDSATEKKDQKKLENTNAELGTIPKMSEVAKQPVYWMCKLRSDVRTIRVEVENGTCFTRYSKDGSEKEASKSIGMRSCWQVFANIRRNLENAEYKCRDISSSRISSSN